MPIPTVKPTIFPNQSVPGALQWQSFSFQPTATSFPSMWYCSALPPGLYFDEDTGAIIGAAVVPGVFSFTLYAENAVGLSDPESCTVGIEASGFVQPSNVLDLTIDVTTRRVSVAGIVTDVGGGSTAANSGGTNRHEALFWAKAGDDVLFNLRFTKGGVPFDPKLTALKFALKKYEPETALLSAGGASGSATWLKLGAGDATSFQLFATLESDLLRGALAEEEDDDTTQFVALGEFEWKHENKTMPLIGNAILRASTRTFGVMIPRDLIANT